MYSFLYHIPSNLLYFLNAKKLFRTILFKTKYAEWIRTGTIHKILLFQVHVFECMAYHLFFELRRTRTLKQGRN